VGWPVQKPDSINANFFSAVKEFFVADGYEGAAQAVAA